jgi:hypothetical protein
MSHNPDSYHGLGSRRRRTLDRGHKAAVQGFGPYSKTSGPSSGTGRHHSKSAAYLLASPPPAPPAPPKASWTPAPPPPPSKATSMTAFSPHFAQAASSSVAMQASTSTVSPPPKALQVATSKVAPKTAQSAVPCDAPSSPEYDPFVEVPDIVQTVAINMNNSLAKITFTDERYAQAVVHRLGHNQPLTCIGGFELEQIESSVTDACVVYILLNGDLRTLEPIVVKDFIEGLF